MSFDYDTWLPNSITLSSDAKKQYKRAVNNDDLLEFDRMISLAYNSKKMTDLHIKSNISKVDNDNLTQFIDIPNSYQPDYLSKNRELYILIKEIIHCLFDNSIEIIKSKYVDDVVTLLCYKVIKSEIVIDFSDIPIMDERIKEMSIIQLNNQSDLITYMGTKHKVYNAEDNLKYIIQFLES